MPLVAYQRAHGANDYLLHHIFLEELERRGVLDEVDIAIDTFIDPGYACQLVKRFPQLLLAVDVSRSRRWIEMLKATLDRGYRWIAMLDRRFDAVMEAPGGRLNVNYRSNLSNWWLYPRVKRRAVLFHSLDEGCVHIPRLRDSLRDVDLFVARTSRAAETAREIGCQNVISACDIVFNLDPGPNRFDEGVAVALRNPGGDSGEAVVSELRKILDRCEKDANTKYDMVRVEEPVGAEMIRRGYSIGRFRNIRMYSGNSMYIPFMARRDAVISCRLHTLIVALLYGNRRILQIQVERSTNKIGEIVKDLDLIDLPVYAVHDLRENTIVSWLDSEKTMIDNERVLRGIDVARKRNATGIDAACEWLRSL